MYYIDLEKPLDKRIKFDNQRKASKEIGITPETLSRILNAKVGATKIMAYCITKHYNKDAEIEDYFTKKGE